MTVAFLPDTQPVYAPPRPLIDPRAKLILYWMHRCGSTTGQRWFFELAGWKDRMPGRGCGELSAMWYAEHRSVYSEIGKYCADPSFLKIAIVRHPLTRAVSSFTVVTDTRSGAQRRAAAQSIAAPDPERRLTFSEFISFLESIDLSTANYHWRLQTAQDWDDSRAADVRLIRIESVTAGLNAVCRQLGRQPVPIRINSAQSKVNGGPASVADLARADFARYFGRDPRGVIRFPHYERFLDERTVPRLAELYARDFELLGYDPAVLPKHEISWPSLLRGWVRACKAPARIAFRRSQVAKEAEL